MSEQNSNSAEATETESKDNKKAQTGTPITVEIKAESTDDKKEPERPGFCCGSCS